MSQIKNLVSERVTKPVVGTNQIFGKEKPQFESPMDQVFESQFDPPEVGTMEIYSKNKPRSKGLTDDDIFKIKIG